MNNDPLIFDFAMAQDKPSSFRKDKSNVCPFCDTGNLTDIYEKSGPMIWLHNKFPTLRDTLQTVLIESDDHHGDIASYSKDYNRKLMRFSMHCFEKMAQDSRFKSTLWYKNYGPLSNGSLVHPHMQIVGLEKEDGYKYIYPNNFEGITVFENEGVNVNFATHPVQGFQEININLKNKKNSSIDLWADWIQVAINYTLNIMYNGRCNSYNLFFYPRQNGYCAKVVPRFNASPYFVGYKLSQCNDEKTLTHEASQLLNYWKNN
ncbi:DUF4931 domain-containing protein [Lactobacillus hominis]|uniref:Galactose-1-phosphate uridylyltransferase n=1 Tax=Lactobacillus hominis DSM 23910 = CRBIP 24.179 TaxID=1423758 RepID=I7LA82_9LACO|nr:DUF4931 domain-containing protein [Lactobacillus hominis]KRM84521.1 galactose-1-phosphate uridylyltransferase [Lactobacillus hominis DSM 23910 = CRBIP 24.179]MCT3348384.1 DUF4931 domain-containing protein [Lactobacillus hominis]CCI82039.1 Galactose-1-phosphate uridylyltransferase [Lactobacillus hominis DSM 23910 = CRBIP 24.179]